MLRPETDPVVARMWSLGWVVLIRLILYLVITGFLVQYMYYGETGRFYNPGLSIIELAVVFFFNLGILAVGSGRRRFDQLIAFTYVLDIAVMTEVTLASGGFNSVFIPFYLPVLVMAAAWLPRRLTAIFPSMATLGAAYIGYAHLIVATGETSGGSLFYESGVLQSLRYMEEHTVVSTMLVLTVLFFVISYLAGVLSERLFVEQRLNSEVLSSMSEGVAVVDSRRMVAYMNAEFRRMFPETRTGGNFLPVARGIWGAAAEKKLDELFGEEAGARMLVNVELPAWEGRPSLGLRVSGIRLRGEDELYGLVFLLSDLTLHKRMENAETRLERFSAISVMAAGLAHEIRNPLASLRSAIQEIGQAFADDSQNRMLTDIVIKESDRLDGVIGRFLDFSREGRLRLQRCRLGGLLRDVATMVTQREDGGRVAIKVEIEDDPEVECDGDRMNEVFLNLALNAVQAAPMTEGRLEMRLGRESANGVEGVAVRFLDNGKGIPEEDFSHLFEPFFTRKAGGTGMGLALSRKQVGMHGGEIEAIRGLAEGACFRVWLPMRQLR